MNLVLELGASRSLGLRASAVGSAACVYEMCRDLNTCETATRLGVRCTRLQLSGLAARRRAQGAPFPEPGGPSGRSGTAPTARAPCAARQRQVFLLMRSRNLFIPCCFSS